MLCVSTFWNHLCKQAYKSTNDNVGQTVQNYFLNVFLSCHDVMWSNFLIWCFAMTPLTETKARNRDIQPRPGSYMELIIVSTIEM
jgi:hypothetical protein